jgi:DNA polymerase-4
VQGLSLDEAFLDVTDSQARARRRSDDRGRDQEEIVARTGVSSVGRRRTELRLVGQDRLRPAQAGWIGVVREDEVTAPFLDPLPIGKLHGIGKKTALTWSGSASARCVTLRLAERCGAVARVRSLCGGHQSASVGIDERPVIADWDEKQISAEETFDTDTSPIGSHLHGDSRD